MTLEHERALVFAFFILAAPIYAGELGGNLVDPARLQNPPIEEIRYATKYNFTGEPLYPFPAAFLQRDTAPSQSAGIPSTSSARSAISIFLRRKFDGLSSSSLA
jgi:D-alanyl-D-alanine dipeptidase